MCICFKYHLLQFGFLLELELLDVEGLVELRDQVLDVRDLPQLLRAQRLQLGREDPVAVVVDVQLKLLATFHNISKIQDSVSDPVWIRIRGSSGSGFGIRIHKLKKRTKMLNNHNIILLFSGFYNILSFNCLLLMRKSYNHEVI